MASLPGSIRSRDGRIGLTKEAHTCLAEVNACPDNIQSAASPVRITTDIFPRRLKRPCAVVPTCTRHHLPKTATGKSDDDDDIYTHTSSAPWSIGLVSKSVGSEVTGTHTGQVIITTYFGCHGSHLSNNLGLNVCLPEKANGVGGIQLME